MTKEEIMVSLGVDESSLNRGLSRVTDGIGKWVSGVRAQINDVGKQFGAIFSVAGIIGFAKHLADTADEIKGTSEALGVGVEFLQGWRHAVDQNSGSVEAANKGLEKFSLLLGEAANGNAEATDKFKSLGISIAEANGTLRPTEDVLLDVAEAMKNTESGTDRARIAADLFGEKIGVKLIPALMAGKQGLSAMVNEASKLSADEVNQIADAQDRIKEAWNDITVSVGHVVGWLTTAARFWGAFSAEGVSASEAMDTVAQMTHKATQNMGQLKVATAEVSAEAKKLASDFETLMEQLHTVTRKRYLDSLSLEERTVELWNEHAAIQKKVAEYSDRTDEEGINLLLKAQLDLHKNELEIERNHNEWIARRLELEQRVTKEKQKQIAVSDLGKLTVEELAGNQTPEGRLSPDKAKARSAKDLQNQAEQHRLNGDSAGATRLLKQADQIIYGKDENDPSQLTPHEQFVKHMRDGYKKGTGPYQLYDNMLKNEIGGIADLKSTDRTPMESATEQLNDSIKTLNSFLSKNNLMTDEGLKVVVADSD